MKTIRMLSKVVLCLVLFSVIGRSQDAGDTLNNAISITALVTGDGWQGPMESPSSIFFDQRSQEIFVTDGGNGRVLIFDEFLIPKYAFDHYVLEPRSGRSVRGEPRDLVTNSLGEIILIDNRAEYIDILDFRGKELQKIYPDQLLGDTSLTVRPQQAAIDDEDNLYVLVLGELTTVLVLNEHFELINQFGQKGAGFTDFDSPLGMYLRDNRLYISDLYARPAIKIFSADGAYLDGFGGHDVDRGDVSFPSGITVLENVAAEQSIWVVDGLRQVIKVFNQEGDFITHVGGYGLKLGEFRYPTDIARRGDSTVYILERVGNRIQRFDIKQNH